MLHEAAFIRTYCEITLVSEHSARSAFLMLDAIGFAQPGFGQAFAEESNGSMHEPKNGDGMHRGFRGLTRMEGEARSL
jgi:hypothetical protein